jgi:hypothetical protein
MFNANNTIVVFCVFADNEICEHYKECISVTYDFYEKMLEFISDMKVDIPGFKNIYTERDFVSDDDISKYWKREDAPENSGKHFYDQLKAICTEHNLNLSENMEKAEKHISEILQKQDFYLNERNCYIRLKNEFEKYGKLIFCVDFDDTLYDFHKKGRTYENVIKLLKRWERYSEVIIFTGNGENSYPMIEEYLDKHNIKYKGINCDSSVAVKGRKTYANVYIDDRGGLPLVYKHLMTLIEEIEGGNIKHDV